MIDLHQPTSNPQAYLSDLATQTIDAERRSASLSAGPP